MRLSWSAFSDHCEAWRVPGELEVGLHSVCSAVACAALSSTLSYQRMLDCNLYAAMQAKIVVASKKRFYYDCSQRSERL